MTMLISATQSIWTSLILFFDKSEKGQDLSEYGLLVGFIAIIILVAVTVFGQNLSAFWNRVATELGNHL
jgi:Flp pilus assembly pilin Flp